VLALALPKEDRAHWRKGGKHLIRVFGNAPKSNNVRLQIRLASIDVSTTKQSFYQACHSQQAGKPGEQQRALCSVSPLAEWLLHLPLLPVSAVEHLPGLTYTTHRLWLADTPWSSH
jgi:hypothetical protein